MKQNQMFSSRDTLEEALNYATAIALSLEKCDIVPALTASNVLANTAIKLLEEKGIEPLAPRLCENFSIEGTTTGRFFTASEKAKVAYAPASSTPTSEVVSLRSQIDALIRKVTDLHDLRFILFALDYILAREKSL